MMLFKILVFLIGTVMLGMLVSMAIMWVLNILLGINDRVGPEYFVDGVWKGDREELSVAKIRHKIRAVSMIAGLVVTGLTLFVALFTEFPATPLGVYLFIFG